MAGKDSTQNPLVSTKAPETSLTVQLHALVLLSISDYITRHTLRQQKGPIVGAVIGQQNGRSYTLEHAFECLTISSNNDVQLDPEFFTERIEQYKDVHKSPQLDVVALFMLGPVDGPQSGHLPILKQAQSLAGSDAVLLLLFHPEMVEGMEGGKLPITLYESFEEQQGEGGEQMRFWERAFEVETGEAEMIGVDFVAKGGGNASAVGGGNTISGGGEASSSKDKKGKGKGKASEKEKENHDDVNGTGAGVLSAEDEELVASLTAKANAIKMLNQRLGLIRAYLASLPKSYLTDATQSEAPPPDANFALLRNINAMLSRLPLLAPPSNTSNTTNTSSDGRKNPEQRQPISASTREREDVYLTSLLAALTRSVAEAQSLGSKFHTAQKERSSKERTPFGGARGVPLLGEGGLMDAGGP